MSLTPRLDRLDKNCIINGNFDFWQRNTSFTLNPSGANRVYDADRWAATNFFNTGQISITRDTDVPSVSLARYSRRYQIASTVTLSLSNHYTASTHSIEGNVLSALVGKAVTLSFWVKSTLTGTFSLAFSAGNDDLATSRYVTTYTVSAANTWEKKVIHLTLDSGAGFGAGVTMGMTVIFPLGVGSNLTTTTANTWLSSSTARALSTANRTDMLSVGNSIKIAQVSLIEGTHTDPEFSLAGRDFLEELSLCQRYFEKTYPMDRTVGSAGSNGDGVLTARWPTAPGSNNELIALWRFAVPKRTQPTMTWYNPTSGTVGEWRHDVPGDTSAITHAGGTNEFGSGVTNGAATNTAFHRVHGTADAEF